jgi:hypothetical protein
MDKQLAAYFTIKQIFIFRQYHIRDNSLGVLGVGSRFQQRPGCE